MQDIAPLPVRRSICTLLMPNWRALVTHIHEQQWNRLASLFKEREMQGEEANATS
jgi:hypothetical protein